MGAPYPNTVGTLDLIVDLRARQVVCSVDVDAPKEGRPTTKVNWLVRQLKQANDKTRLECNVLNQRGGAGASELLGQVREHPEALILDPRRRSDRSRSRCTVRWDSKPAAGRARSSTASSAPSTPSTRRFFRA